MRRWLSGRAIIAILLVGFGAVFGKAFFDIHREAATRRLEMELQSVILPHLELHDATVAEALAYLQTEGQKAGLRPGIRFTVLSKQESQKFFRKRIGLSGVGLAMIPGVPPNSEDASSTLAERSDAQEAPQRITVELTNIPLSEAFKYVAGLSGLHMHQRVTHDSVLFFDVSGDGTVDPFFCVEFAVNPLLWADSPKLPNGSFDVRSQLAGLGIFFYEGSFAELNPITNKLVMTNTQEQIDVMSTMGGSRIPTMVEKARYWIESQLSVFSPAPALPSPGLPPDLPTPDPQQGPAEGEPTSPSPAVPGL